MQLCKEVYAQTHRFPKEEMYGLTSQIRRSSVSIPSNIAEGCARNSVGKFIQFLGVASGSVAELYTQLTLAKDIGYLEPSTHNALIQQTQEIGKMLSGLKASQKPKPSLATSN